MGDTEGASSFVIIINDLTYPVSGTVNYMTLNFYCIYITSVNTCNPVIFM